MLYHGATKLIRPRWLAPWLALVIPFLFYRAQIWEQRKEWNRQRREFVNDMRVELADWIRAHLPHGTKIIQSHRAGLPAPDYAKPGSDNRQPLHCEITTVYSPLDAGSLNELRAEGFTHVLLDLVGVRREKRGAEILTDIAAEELHRRRQMIAELENGAKLIWRHPSRRIAAMSPGLLLYSIDGSGKAIPYDD